MVDTAEPRQTNELASSSDDPRQLADESSSKALVIEDFSNPRNQWRTLNDPVMGGQSYSRVKIDEGVAHFEGSCEVVPRLGAPGFITMTTGNRFGQVASFPDVSTCEGLEFVLKTNVDYEGYRISFGKAHPKGARFAYGFKSPLPMSELPPVGEFGLVRIPFNRFSDKWNDATGEIEVECADDERFCPTKKWLRSMEQLSVWGEGVEGAVDLKIQSISAVGCDPSASEEAIAPSKIVSNYHSVMSNPFFLAMILVLCLLICSMGLICYCCYRCGKRSRDLQTDDFEVTKLTTMEENVTEDEQDLEESEVRYSDIPPAIVGVEFT